MKRNRISFGEPTRPPPTRGYVRKSIPASKSSVIKKQAALKFGGGEGPPLRGGDPTPRNVKLEEISIEEVLKSWRQLDSMARKEVLAMMSLELQRSPSGDAGDLELWADAVYEALRSTIGTSDVAAYGPQVIRRSMGAYSAWEPVADFAKAARLDALRPAERFRVFQLLAKLLVTRAKRVANRADIPLTPKLVAQNAQYIAAIFDNAFPNYLAAGLVGSVTRALVGDRRQKAEVD